MTPESLTVVVRIDGQTVETALVPDCDVVSFVEQMRHKYPHGDFSASIFGYSW